MVNYRILSSAFFHPRFIICISVVIRIFPSASRHPPPSGPHLASDADVLRLVTEERVTSQRTSAWEASPHFTEIRGPKNVHRLSVGHCTPRSRPEILLSSAVSETSLLLLKDLLIKQYLFPLTSLESYKNRYQPRRSLDHHPPWNQTPDHRLQQLKRKKKQTRVV